MDNSFQILAQWTQARKHPDPVEHDQSRTQVVVSKANERWKPPPPAGFKINVDASVTPGVKVFSTGMVLRNHEGQFVAAKTKKLAGEISVVEAEAVGNFGSIIMDQGHGQAK